MECKCRQALRGDGIHAVLVVYRRISMSEDGIPVIQST